VLLGFRNRNITILVATDVVSRGIDVVGIELVVNYDVPADPEDYVHRIGRTARAETQGEAVTLVNDFDQRKFQRIEKMIEKEIEKLPLPEGFETGPEYTPEKKVFSKGRPGKGKQNGGPVAKKPQHASASDLHAGARKHHDKPKHPGHPNIANSAPRVDGPPVFIAHEKRKREYEERVKRREGKGNV